MRRYIANAHSYKIYLYMVFMLYMPPPFVF